MSNSKVTKKLFIFSAYDLTHEAGKEKDEMTRIYRKQGKKIPGINFKFPFLLSLWMRKSRVEKFNICIKYTANAKVPEENSSVFASSSKNEVEH